MKKKATTTKLFIVVIASWTQRRKEGSKIVGGEALGNKHKPKLKPQKCTKIVKRVYSPE